MRLERLVMWVVFPYFVAQLDAVTTLLGILWGAWEVNPLVRGLILEYGLQVLLWWWVVEGTVVLGLFLALRWLRVWRFRVGFPFEYLVLVPTVVVVALNGLQILGEVI
jgi:hypothetical protein